MVKMLLTSCIHGTGGCIGRPLGPIIGGGGYMAGYTGGMNGGGGTGWSSIV